MTVCLTKQLARQLLVVACITAGFVVTIPAAAQDGHLPMTAQEIVELARTGVGHGYFWDHGSWTRDGSQIGKCTVLPNKGGCGDCTFEGKYGSDCSGFVAKVWQVPIPTAVEHDAHPYSTLAFASPSGKPWSKVDSPDEVRRGDAVVNGGAHIMLIDQKLGDGSYMVYHASGCNVGIVHQKLASISFEEFMPIRRDDVTDGPTKSCSGHGTFAADKTCHCTGHTAGDDCERCEPGFVRYPQCTPADCGLVRPEKSTLKGTLNCGSKYTFKLSGGGNNQTQYGCGPSPLNAEEVGFQFRPAGVGTATLSVSSAADVSMMVMRHDCSPDSCFASKKDSLELSFGGDDEFFVVLDAPSATDESVTIEVACEVPRSKFIGDPCSEDTDCPDALTHRWGTKMDGFCYEGPAGSFCSVECTGSCPDLINAAPTACAEDPDESVTRGVCLPLKDELNFECGGVPGTRPEEHPRHGNTGTREFCYPVEDPGACVADFKGMVVDDATGAPIAGAQVTYTTDSGSQSVMTNELGQFVSGDIPCGSHEFLVEATNYSPQRVGREVQARGKDVGQVRLQSFAAQCVSATALIEGRVLNGNDTSQAIPGATVELREGNGVSGGEAVDSQTSDETGAFSFSGLVGGDYTLSAERDGFTSNTLATVTVCESASQEEDIHLTPETPELEHNYRFVLSWDQPEDLDLHLLTPSGIDVFYWDTCRGSATEEPFATLDVDHTAADGPETITLVDFVPGRYELFVHNFAAQNWQEPELAGVYADNPASLSDSGAVLTVFDGSADLVDRFPVPSSGSGLYWNVLEIELDSSGIPHITQIQSLTNSRVNPFSEYAGDCNPQ